MAAPADIEQMNKLRKTLGLPLLSVSGQPPQSSEGPTFKESKRIDEDTDSDQDDEPASTLETREAAGYGNWKQLREEEKKRVLREQRKRDIQRQRDADAKARKLEGKGLGDVGDDDDLDTKAWLKGQKKRQSKIERERAERLERELAERERDAAVEYTSKDLAGVQVAHEIGDFDEGTGEQILTLKDTEIGKGDDSEQEDVLENADLVAREKVKEKLDLKKRKVYDVNDDSEKGVLSQYDERKRKAFTLDGQGATIEEREAKRQQIGEKLKNTVSLDILKAEPVSDYLEIKMKKPKKEKKSKRQKLLEEDDDIFPPQNGSNGDAMEVDSGSTAAAPTRPRAADDIFNDDDDLASALARTRAAVLKKQKRKPEDIVKLLKQEENDEAEAEGEANGGLVLDDTTVFLDNLSSRPQEDQPVRGVKKSVEKVKSESPAPQMKHEDEDHPMVETYSGIENEEELVDRIKRERSTVTPEVPPTGLEEEKTLDQGMGAALSLLRQRGLLKESDATDRNTLYKDRQKFIIEARLREHENEQRARMQRERDRQSGKLTGMSVKEREEHARWQNTQREHQSSIQAAATFNREYKPDVQIKYVDDDGRIMNQKEAFKHLSHQFHGKGSGKLKTEKHLKKVAEEKKREATSILDSSKATGMSNAQGTMGKKNKEAGVRLA
ncbi:uncharacterized protein A1O5_11948 [Cladophialophora psammophila CBS 110553]|uniref:U4/U6.U5 tri-snRNP-associated protein 1 n=1 Tax=Cladophialophora psammophila CBS 110553 TaxID=1182543 RepID=W9W9F3_9EURO|nr:uncharacterized protein A1O5_11948 [Cladophialophora psammophila CBS 110553]EXJ61156.1 hypothetical protein A1O5_11948 [Cladophialophora psammophila CBS 110553]